MKTILILAIIALVLIAYDDLGGRCMRKEDNPEN
jgi:hypothetical protein